MTSGLPQQPAVASRVGRLAERAMTFAVDERDDDLAVARLAWLAQDDQAALEEAAEVCLERAQGDLVVRARAALLLARVRDHQLAVPPPRMQTQAAVSYGEWSATQAGIGGRADLEGATANMSTEVGDLDAALTALYQLPLEQFVTTRDQLARRLRAAGDRDTARRVAARRRPPVSAWAANQLASAAPNAGAELLEAGAALRQAQQDALAGQPGAARQLRTATAHLRAAITRLSARAETLLIRAGHAASDATLARLAATLQAAATGDEATRAALAQGRLPRALEQTRAAAERAQAALEQAQGQAASRQQAAHEAHQRAERLAAAAQDLADQAAAAATAAEKARRAARTADRDADAVAERVQVAEQAAAATAAHAAAASALEELEDQT